MPTTGEHETSHGDQGTTAYALCRELAGQRLAEVEERLLSICGSGSDVLGRAARDAVEAGGKRLRPILAIVSAMAAGSEVTQATTDVAVAVEVMHLASLMHDDVVDQARVRRGRPTVRETWGNRVAVLTGDYLAARAYWELSSLEHRSYVELLANVAMEMCVTEGDLAQGGAAQLQPEECLRVARGKTAALLSACCRLGALSVDASPDTTEALGRYGEGFGMAFQLTDDLLDVYGEEGVLGKRPGQDIASGQRTYPVAVALASSHGEELAQALATFPADADTDGDLGPIRELVRLGGGEAATRELVDGYVASAVEALVDLPAPSTTAADALADLVRSLPDRSY